MNDARRNIRIVSRLIIGSFCCAAIAIAGCRDAASPPIRTSHFGDPGTRVFSFMIGDTAGQADENDPDIVTAIVRRRLNLRWPNTTSVVRRGNGFDVRMRPDAKITDNRIVHLCHRTGILTVIPLAIHGDSLLADPSAIRRSWDFVKNERVVAEWIDLNDWDEQRERLDKLGAYHYRSREYGSRLLVIMEYGFLVPRSYSNLTFAATSTSGGTLAVAIRRSHLPLYEDMIASTISNRPPGDFPISLALEYDGVLLGIGEARISAKDELRFEVLLDRIQADDLIATVMGGQLYCRIEFLGVKTVGSNLSVPKTPTEADSEGQ